MNNNPLEAIDELLEIAKRLGDARMGALVRRLADQVGSSGEAGGVRAALAAICSTSMRSSTDKALARRAVRRADAILRECAR